MADLERALADRHPDNFHKHTLMIACSAVIVEDGRRLLVRDPHGFWAGPGGWVERGERPEEAVLRELREELGVEGEVTGVLHPHLVWQVDRTTEELGFLLFLYRVRLLSQDFTLQPSEVTAVRWVGPGDWCDLPMLPYVHALWQERAAEWLGDSPA